MSQSDFLRNVVVVELFCFEFVVESYIAALFSTLLCNCIELD